MKRIVICADGTWNRRDQLDAMTGKRRPTNVTKLARAVLPRAPDGVDQVVYYHDGIGTGGPLDRFTGGAFGHGMEYNVRELYRFIVYNYEPGDELYLFGFSRGAFTVRTLAGFMNFAQLAEKDDDYYVPDMYACYEKNRGPGTAEWKHLFEDTDTRSGKPRVQGQRACPEIRFIGVWDTVGALGAPGLLGQLIGSKRYQYHDVALNPSIRNAVHALAIDERRKPFAPTLWTRPPGWDGQLVQAWFAGVHSDIGGGYEDDSLANEPLHWLLAYAREQGLAMNEAYLSHFKPNIYRPLHDTLSAMYRLTGPHQRPMGQAARGEERVHRSALNRMARPECAYAPPNLQEAQRSGTPLGVVPAGSSEQAHPQA